MDRNIIKTIVNNAVKNVLKETAGDSWFYWDGDEGYAREKMHLDPKEWKYDRNARKFYKKANKKNKPVGRKKNETEDAYLDRVRKLNKKFADAENEISGEEWRPVKNTGRFFGGASDYTNSHAASNMGRIRRIDFKNPNKSFISYGYDAPTRKAMQYHLDTFDDSGLSQKTTPPIHTIVADAWLDEPEGNIEDYDVEHIDGDYHNNRVDNLRYVLRKGRFSKNNNDDAPVTENFNRIIRESIRRVLREKMI